ncbi:MAG: chemotaxis protein CheB [Nitrospirota bacterium]
MAKKKDVKKNDQNKDAGETAPAPAAVPPGKPIEQPMEEIPAKEVEVVMPEEPEKADLSPKIEKGGFFIVGIGASAGGLEAFEQFFSHMPPDSGMAFVLVPHLSPEHKSIMSELLRRYTKMEIFEAKDGMQVKPDSIYIIPPDKDMSILNRTLHLMKPAERRGMRHPIDFFFRSLAADQGERAICIILSGTGTEGTLGLKEIKGAGGLVMV